MGIAQGLISVWLVCFLLIAAWYSKLGHPVDSPQTPCVSLSTVVPSELSPCGCFTVPLTSVLVAELLIRYDHALCNAWNLGLTLCPRETQTKWRSHLWNISCIFFPSNFMQRRLEERKGGLQQNQDWSSCGVELPLLPIPRGCVPFAGYGSLGLWRNGACRHSCK